MPTRFKIAAVPLNIAWADRDENLQATHAAIQVIDNDTDLVVLPELFSTGYIQDPDVICNLAESVDGPTMQQVHQWADIYNVAIAGSFLCKEGDKLYNRAFLVEPSGETVYYDKRHLFSLSAEHKIFTPGSSLPPVVRYRSWNIALLVCYDLRFPVWCRNRSMCYDIMLVPANWPQSRAYAWTHLLMGRAIENQAVYVGANRGGADDYGTYDGQTFIIDALGKDISTPNDGIIYAVVDKNQLQQTRTKLPFGDDADDFICTL